MIKPVGYTRSNGMIHFLIPARFYFYQGLVHTYPNIFENGDFFSIYIFKNMSPEVVYWIVFLLFKRKCKYDSIPDRTCSVWCRTSRYLFENLRFLSFSSVNRSSWQQQMCNITSGTVAKYVAASSGSFDKKTWTPLSESISSAQLQVESRDGVKISVILTKILYKPLVID